MLLGILHGRQFRKVTDLAPFSLTPLFPSLRADSFRSDPRRMGRLPSVGSRSDGPSAPHGPVGVGRVVGRDRSVSAGQVDVRHGRNIRHARALLVLLAEHFLLQSGGRRSALGRATAGAARAVAVPARRGRYLTRSPAARHPSPVSLVRPEATSVPLKRGAGARGCERRLMQLRRTGEGAVLFLGRRRGREASRQLRFQARLGSLIFRRDAFEWLLSSCVCTMPAEIYVLSKSV